MGLPLRQLQAAVIAALKASQTFDLPVYDRVPSKAPERHVRIDSVDAESDDTFSDNGWQAEVVLLIDGTGTKGKEDVGLIMDTIHPVFHALSESEKPQDERLMADYYIVDCSVAYVAINDIVRNGNTRAQGRMSLEFMLSETVASRGG